MYLVHFACPGKQRSFTYSWALMANYVILCILCFLKYKSPMWAALRKANAMTWKMYYAHLRVFCNHTECIFNATLTL